MTKVFQNNDGNTTVTLSLQDWELSADQDAANAVTENCKTEFTAKFEFDKNNGYIWFSVADENLKKAYGDSFGMSGRIEIRNGAPSISLGMHPDENVVHVMSNGINQISIVPESNNTTYRQGTVEHTPQKYDGIIFDMPEYDEDVLAYRKVIATKQLIERFPTLEKLQEWSWFESNVVNALTTQFSLPNDPVEYVATIEFSDRSVGHVVHFSVSSHDKPSVNSKNTEWYSNLSDNALVDVIISDATITQLIESNEDDSLWDEDTIIEAVADALDLQLDESKSSVMNQLLMFFNQYDVTTNTFTVGNTKYHRSIENLNLLSLTDPTLLSHLGYGIGEVEIMPLRKGIFNDFENGVKYAVHKDCDHKNADGSCAGHRK